LNGTDGRPRFKAEFSQVQVYIITDAASFGFGHFITFCGIAWRMGEVSLAEQVGLYRYNLYSERCRFEIQVGYGLSRNFHDFSEATVGLVPQISHDAFITQPFPVHYYLIIIQLNAV